MKIRKYSSYKGKKKKSIETAPGEVHLLNLLDKGFK